MDNAVALVRAYLQLNGCFTITEYPVLRKRGLFPNRPSRPRLKPGSIFSPPATQARNRAA